MKSFYVYILECSDGSFYTGVTSNLEMRLEQHNLGGNKKSYTYSRRPFILSYVMEFNSATDAILAEKQIKGWSRKKKIALINGDVELLKRLSIPYSRAKRMQK